MTLIDSLPSAGSFNVTGTGHLPSAFAVTDLANASVAAAGLEMAGLIAALNLAPAAPAVTVDQRLASLWFGYSFRPAGWEMPSLWDPIAGNYEAADGWVRLHTNLQHHRDAALRALGCEGTREAVSAAVRKWDTGALETAVVEAGGAAAMMRSRTDWLAHPQGSAVAGEPLIHWIAPRRIPLRDRPEATLFRPLAGLKVLDLTRVLAGPIATRTLAGFGAEVLRIDPIGWDEPGTIPEISLGKRMACLDLKTEDGRARFETLLGEADVLVHGYRADALENLGLGLDWRDAIAPNRVEVTLDAYGWTGPWAKRRGFDSLVQMSAGIAHAGMGWAGSDKPSPLPVQALDHATGYLLAAAALSALASAARGEAVPHARLSLARTAELLASLESTAQGPQISTAADGDYTLLPEESGWGPGQRLKPPLRLEDTALRWDLPAGRCGTSEASWSS